MTIRRGAAKGAGKGYKNLRHFPKDPMVHAQAARGMKQPQRAPFGGWRDVAPFGRMVKTKYGVRRFGGGKAPMSGKYAERDHVVFPIKKGVEIVAHYEKTSRGFRHVAVLKINGHKVDMATANYLNRTYERFEYQTAIKNLLDKIGERTMTDAEKKQFMAQAEGKSREDVERQFGSIAMVAKMGELIGGDTQKEKNDWKLRMMKAGLPALDVPEDWGTLSEDEKEKRLNKVIEFMGKKPSGSRVT